MTLLPPKIDLRTAGDVVGQVNALLQKYVPAYDPVPGDPSTGLITDPLREALVGIFGRLAELTIERLNRVPEKNFLAFLDLLGASRLPPQPARVPLTFFLAAGSVVPGVVPAGTQVAAAPGPGEKEPTTFETERELVVTPAKLSAILTRDPEADAYSDLSTLAQEAVTPGAPLFRGNRPLDHMLYIGLKRFLELEGLATLALNFEIETPMPGDARVTRWERWGGKDWQPVAFVGRGDPTEGLRKSGRVQLEPPPVPVPSSIVDKIESRWLRCRLDTPINSSDAKRQSMVRSNEIRKVQSVSASASVRRTGLPIDTAFTNQTEIDVSKDFFPFGEVPRFGDTLWLRVDEAFSQPNANVVLRVTMTKASTKAARVPKLAWEIWNGSDWAVLGISSPGENSPASFSETTKALTNRTAAGDTVAFRCPGVVGPRTVNGVDGFWLRVRIISGDYGRDAHYTEEGTGADAKLKFHLADVDPPVIASIKIDYTLERAGTPDAILTYNDFRFVPVMTGFVPFKASDDERPTVYLGFELPSGLTAFPNLPVSLFARTAEARYGQPTVPLSPTRSRRIGLPGDSVKHTFEITNPAAQAAAASLTILGTSWLPAPTIGPMLSLGPSGSALVELAVKIPGRTAAGSIDVGLLAVELSTEPGIRHVAAFATQAARKPPTDDPARLAWEYWDGARWSSLLVRDGSDRFGRSGSVEFLAPPQLVAREDFGLGRRHWIRVRWERGDYAIEPRLGRFLLNTTMASQTITVANESLGSSDGSKEQRFRATSKPVLPGQTLEVHEPELPPAGERETLEREEGPDAITTILEPAARPNDRWIRWHEVHDFHGSGPRDRHYVLDRLAGEIRLGDGQRGLIPSLGTGLRLRRYQTGGGSAGNRPARVIVQLKTTVPYVDRVTNLEPAVGGADAEPMDSVLARAPRTVRHGGRAVTREDYEDLAVMATPEVARAKCVPLANLVETPLVTIPAAPGELSVIIVPRSAAAKPLPSLELVRRVQDFLDTVRAPTARLTVVGPLYLRVNIDGVIAVVSLDGATGILTEVQRTVTAFLHPLTGGLDGKGWDFGRKPHLSDLYALIEAVPGVDHVPALKVEEEEDPRGSAATGRFLVYAGALTIGVVLEEA